MSGDRRLAGLSRIEGILVPGVLYQLRYPVYYDAIVQYNMENVVLYNLS